MEYMINTVNSSRWAHFLACWSQAPFLWQRNRCGMARSVLAGWEDVLWETTDHLVASRPHTNTQSWTWSQRNRHDKVNVVSENVVIRTWFLAMISLALMRLWIHSERVSCERPWNVAFYNTTNSSVKSTSMTPHCSTAPTDCLCSWSVGVEFLAALLVLVWLCCWPWYMEITFKNITVCVILANTAH